MKVMPDTTAVESWTNSDERMKELIGHAWDAVKRLTLQVPKYPLYHRCWASITLIVSFKQNKLYISGLYHIYKPSGFSPASFSERNTHVTISI